MRLDQDLIRSLLLEAEGEEPVDLSPYTDEQIAYHKAQLIDARLAKGFIHAGLGDIIGAEINDLTWEGHEFLANARNDTIWNRGRKEVAKLGGSVSLEVLKAILAQVALNLLQR